MWEMRSRVGAGTIVGQTPDMKNTVKLNLSKQTSAPVILDWTNCSIFIRTLRQVVEMQLNLKGKGNAPVLLTAMKAYWGVKV
jgi:hypothetical protein